MKLPAIPTKGTLDSTLNFEHIQRIFRESARWFVVGEDLGQTAFTNEWGNNEATKRKAEYSMDGWGYVHLRGVIAKGKSTFSAFTLPEGFRPKEEKSFKVNAAGKAGNVFIEPGGEVKPADDSGEVKTYCYLDQVTFSVN